jgi:hypothetical protein
MFAYYVPNAAATMRQAKIKVVDSTKGSPRFLENAVTRLGVVGNLLRRPRQGAFDNVHFAPKMRIPSGARISHGPSWGVSVFDSRPPATMTEVSEDERPGWGFDDVVMAPICAHDCFHMHWRWTDGVPPTDTTARGFGYATDKNGAMVPYLIRGAPLIPPNQDLYIRLLNDRSLVYEAVAFRAKADSWQVICHHGTGYVLKTKALAELGRVAQDADAVRGAIPRFWEPGQGQGSELFPTALWAKDYWSVFYWRNRYYFPEDVSPLMPAERVQIVDMQLLLTETPSQGRG